MGKKAMVWLVIAALFIVIGSILFTAAMTKNRWDFTKLSTVQYETRTYNISESFENISILTDTSDILFVHGGNQCAVFCHEAESLRHSVTVENGTLIVTQNFAQQWQDYIGINIGAPKITVYLPGTQYQDLLIAENTGDICIPDSFHFSTMDITVSTGDVDNYASATEMMKIRTDTGHIRMDTVSADTISLATSTGKTHLSNVTCRQLQAEGTTGDITLQRVIATESMSIVRNTGDVTFDRCDAGDIFVKTSTGDIEGTLNSGKVFVANSSTGDVDVPQSTTGGKCELSTSTGDIEITVN